MQDWVSDVIRNFGMANLMAEVALDRVEQRFAIELGRAKKKAAGEKYPNVLVDIEAAVRAEANEMAKHYELFYCLEQSIRKLIAQRLSENFGARWWDGKKADERDVVPQAIKESARKNRENEISQAITARSEKLIDYTTFGELADIIVSNWEIFGDMFTKRDAVQRVLRLLNTLRGPIAHCCPLADHEVARLHITVQDWFKIMS